MVMVTTFALLTGALTIPMARADVPAAVPAGVPASQAAGRAAVSKPAPIAKTVQKRLADKGTADYWVVFKAKADLAKTSNVSDWNARGQAVVDALKSTASKSQASVKALLDKEKVSYTPFWASNRILVKGGDTALTAQLAQRSEVAGLTAKATIPYKPPAKGQLESTINALEWNISAIKADQVWSQFGVRGEGIVVANNDTGVQYEHPALVGKYRGNLGSGTFDHNYNWFDPSTVCATPAPCDWAGHGSHTMGTMSGDDGTGNQVGVAPGVKWIAGMGCDLPPNGCSDAALMAVGQWMLEPRDLNGQNPRVDKRPNIINNSWGGDNGAVVDPWYDDVLQAWTASGIFGVFSNGNAGPACNTTGSPADSPYAFGVGGFQQSGAVYANSSRGPGAGSAIRPNVSAPAVNVRSSVPPGSYANYTGTSMAAPHVAGAVALMWSAAPALIGDVTQTRAILARTAIDVDDTSCGGTAANNNVWGEGKVDALAAVTESPRGDVGTVSGKVTSAADGSPIAGATVALSGPASRQTTTGTDGTYQLTVPVGAYTAKASAFGYTTGEVAVTVVKDTVVTQDFALVAAPTYDITGVVRDTGGRALAGVSVTVERTPLPSVTSGADGSYTIPAVPAGTYNLTASGGGCLESQTKEVVVDSAKTVDFQLAGRKAKYGYSCTTESTPYVEGTTALTLTGDDTSAPVTLPFPVWFFGDRYSAVNVASNGHLSFAAPSLEYENGGIPDPVVPNAAIYPFWDDLVLDSQSKAYTAVTGTAPNRSFVIEWRNVTFYDDGHRMDFEVVLGENGDVTLNYRNLDPESPVERGSSATVGIESGDGSDALQYSLNQPVLADGQAIKFTLPPNGFVVGKVVDRNDGNPVDNAKIVVKQGTTVIREIKTKADGVYATQLLVGDYSLTTSAEHYVAATTPVTITQNATVTKNISLRTGKAVVDAPAFKWVVPAGVKQSGIFSIANSGSAVLSYKVTEAGGKLVTGVSASQNGTSTLTARKANPGAKTAESLYSKAAAAAAVPEARGDVLKSWPTGMALPWGVNVSDKLWFSDPNIKQNKEFTFDGAATGRQWTATWAGQWNADMAFDSRRGLVCQVSVMGDNGIHCWDPATGTVSYKVTGTPWGSIDQRGLAYSPADDSFYIGGWWEDVVYHVAGSSSATPGAVLGKCKAPAGTAIAGLAYNPSAHTLWVTTSQPTSPVLRLNPDTCEQLGSFGFPDTVSTYAGAGVEIDDAGKLWMVSQKNGRAYLVDAGIPITTNVPWLSASPASGKVAIGAEVDVQLTVNSTGLAPGVYRASVYVQSNSGRQPYIEIPVELTVSSYWKGVDVGGTAASVDAAGLPWVADAAYRAGRFGWIGASTVATAPATVDIRGTEDDQLYRTQRVGMDAYQFDKLPAGKYEVTLDFAELARSPRVDWRMFDVDINGSYVLVGYDIAQSVGGQNADRRTYIVDVPTAGGSLTVTFHDRRGYQPSVVNAIRVVHRPDLK